MNTNTRWIALLQDVSACEGSDLSADLAGTLESAGLANVVFDEEALLVLFDSGSTTQELEVSLKTVIRECCGLRARFALRPLAGFRKTLSNNPFPDDAEKSPDTLYVLFLKHPPEESVRQKLDDLKEPEEKWSLLHDALFLVIPSGFASSRLAREAQPQIHVGAVIRSWAELRSFDQFE